MHLNQSNASSFQVYSVPDVVFSVFYYPEFLVPCFTIPDILLCIPYIFIPAFRVLLQPPFCPTAKNHLTEINDGGISGGIRVRIPQELDVVAFWSWNLDVVVF